MVWYFIGVYIMNRKLHGRLKIQNFSSHDEKYFTRSLHLLVKYYSPFEEKFRISTSHVIFSLYTSHWSVGNSGCLGCFWFRITVLKIHFFPRGTKLVYWNVKIYSHMLKKQTTMKRWGR